MSRVSKNKELLGSLFFGLKIREMEDFKRINFYLNSLRVIAPYESDYHKKITDSLTSKKGYNYRDFLRVASALVRDSSYELFLPNVLKFYYSAPEQDKPHWIVPSQDLLKDLGLDVRGKNNLERVVEVVEDPEKKLLYLDSKRAESCGFFAESVSYKKETLAKCLSDKEDKRGSAEEGPPVPDGSSGAPLGDGGKETPSAVTEGSPKSFNEPSHQEDVTITLEQIREAGLMEEKNSSAFGYYVQFWFNRVNDYIRKKNKNTEEGEEPFFEQLVSALCPEVSRCSKGLDLTQIKKPMIPRCFTLYQKKILRKQ